MRNYIEEITKKFGHAKGDDVSHLDLKDFRTLGHAVKEEWERISGGEFQAITAQRKLEEMIYEASNNAPEVMEDVKSIRDMTDEIDIIAHELREVGWGSTPTSRHQAELNREQQYRLMDDIAVVCKKYIDNQQHVDWFYSLQLWSERLLHANLNTSGYMREWLAELRREQSKRNGEKEDVKTPLDEKTREDFFNMMYEQSWLPNEVDEDFPEYTDEEIAMDVMTEQMREQAMQISIKDRAFEALGQILEDDRLTSEEKIAKANDAVRRQQNKQINKAAKQPSVKETARLLQKIDPVGHTVRVEFKNNDHFKRGLALRYGINLSHKDYHDFHVEEVAWLNNYYGYFKNYEDKRVIVALKISEQNKPGVTLVDWSTVEAYRWTASTTMVDGIYGDDYLELEIKYATWSADWAGYTIKQLLEANGKIEAELAKKRASV